MRSLGLKGVVRGKTVKTTISAADAACPLDRVNRQFRAERPNALWVADFTYVKIWQGSSAQEKYSLSYTSRRQLA